MSGKKSQLTSLETRKQLLLVESELNRAQLLNELRDFKNEIHHLKHQVYAIGSVTSSAAKLAATFSAIRQAFSHREDRVNGKSWISTLLNGAQTCASLWGMLRSAEKTGSKLRAE
jgi:hypothetical protein